jgi:hypothetical protein
MKESMREAFLRAATTPICSGDPGPYPPGSHPGGYFLADIDQHGVVHCCGDDRCASGYHDTCNKRLSKAEIRRRGASFFRGAQWIECDPDVDEGSPLIRIILAVVLGLGATWLGGRWAAEKALPGWTGSVLGVLTVLLVLWLLRPRRTGL